MRTFLVKIVIVIFLLILYLYMSSKDNEEMINIENPSSVYTWNINSCPFVMTENIKQVFKENGIKLDNKKPNNKIHLPCTYDNVENEINQLVLGNNDRTFIIHGADNIVAKDYLWKNLVLSYGIENAVKLSPMTYLLYDKNDLKRLNQDFEQDKIYIMKKNIQRQEGLKITNDMNEILENKNGYVLVQELLQNPYLINKRKINLRVYVLVLCYKNNFEVFMYKNGFMYYTKDEFKKGSTDAGPNITTGYIDRWVYDVNPLTHEDFKTYLDNTNNRTLNDPESVVVTNGQKVSDFVFDNIEGLIRTVFGAFYNKIGNKSDNNKLFNQISFQLFGVDVAIDDKLNAQIMEVNKGPDLGSKDVRDGDLKRGLILDILRTTGVVANNIGNKFKKIVER